MNRKAQGLPLEFIVLAAIAILILVIVVVIVIGGGTSVTKSVSPVVLRQNCETACSKLQQIAAGKQWINAQGVANTDVWTAMGLGTTKATNLFCIKQEYEGGPAGGSNCIDIQIQCYLTFADGVQKQIPSC